MTCPSASWAVVVVAVVAVAAAFVAIVVVVVVAFVVVAVGPSLAHHDTALEARPSVGRTR